MTLDDEPPPHFAGLPEEVTPPPSTGLEEARAELYAAVDEGVPVGEPTPSSAMVPMYGERATQHVHAGAQGRITQWRSTEAGRLLAVIDGGDERAAELTAEKDDVDAEIDAKRADIQTLRDQLIDRDRRFPTARGGPVATVVLYAVLFFGVVEQLTMVPLTGRHLGIPDWAAWAYSLIVVAGSNLSSFFAAWFLHRKLGYEGPPRHRAALTAWTTLFAGAAVAALASVVTIRLAAVEDGHEKWPVAILVVAVQATAQLLAAAHGWWVGNTRVRELRHLEGHLSGLEKTRSWVADELSLVNTRVEVLRSFDLTAWTRTHRSWLAEEYARLITSTRRIRWVLLMEAEKTESADLLQLLPYPTYPVPSDDEDDQDDEWLAGFALAL